jgi:hypothetical protein
MVLLSCPRAFVARVVRVPLTYRAYNNILSSTRLCAYVGLNGNDTATSVTRGDISNHRYRDRLYTALPKWSMLIGRSRYTNCWYKEADGDHTMVLALRGLMLFAMWTWTFQASTSPDILGAGAA